MSEGKLKYPLLRKLRKSCREMDEIGDGGYLVGGPSFELDVRRKQARGGEGGMEASQSRSECSRAD